MTIKGERVMHREMGTTYSYISSGQLFEPIKKIELLEKILDLEIETQ